MPAQGAGKPRRTPSGRAGSPPLPPGLDLLWGRRGRGQRGPKPGLSVDAIVAAAIRLADAEGLEAVSMARVAEQLGFTTMSLYRHVSSKEELLQLMWNASAQGAEDLVLAGDDWRSRLRTWATIQREMIDRHPWITQMPMAAPPMAPNSLTFVERGLEAMDGTGLRRRGQAPGHRPDQLLHAERSPDGARRGPRRTRRGRGGRRRARPAWTFEALLREVADEQTYPRLHRLAWSDAASVTARPASTSRKSSCFGLDRILDGVEALIGKAQP